MLIFILVFSLMLLVRYSMAVVKVSGLFGGTVRPVFVLVIIRVTLVF